MAETRVSIRLSDDARRGWDVASKRHGLPLSALLEAMGRHISRGEVLLPPEVVATAHEIEFERRSRRRL